MQKHGWQIYSHKEDSVTLTHEEHDDMPSFVSDRRFRGIEEANSKLRKLLEPFAAFACSPPGKCNCHNCKARDAIAGAIGD